MRRSVGDAGRAQADAGDGPRYTSQRGMRTSAMGTYLFVICLIAGLVGAYVALLPLVAWSDANTGISGAGPG